MRTDEALDELWQCQPHVIRSFLDVRPRYEKLAEEVAYILEKHIRYAKVEYSAVTHRTKTVDSFCEKVKRKDYKEPLREITDIAGVRVVFLYKSDRPQLEAAIERNLEVIDRVDKIEAAGPERFGYGALHYLVRLGRGASGARYDDLKDLICEVQVRTILQDAWAIVAHHMSYKEEAAVPEELRRDLNGLSALFELADKNFDSLKREREAYGEAVKKQLEGTRGAGFFQQDVNLDNLIAYLNWKFPDRETTAPGHAAMLLSELTEHGYGQLAQIEEMVNRCYEAVQMYERTHPPLDRSTRKRTVYAPVGFVRTALELMNEEYLNAKDAPASWKKTVRGLRHMVRK